MGKGEVKEIRIVVNSSRIIIAGLLAGVLFLACVAGGLLLVNVVGSEQASAYGSEGYGAKYWFFAEGHTGDGFEEWVLVQNPNSEINCYYADVYVFFNIEGEGQSSQNVHFTLNMGERKTINVNEIVGEGKNVSVKVVSDKPVIAERAMYYNYGGWCTGGSQTFGYNEAR